MGQELWSYTCTHVACHPSGLPEIVDRWVVARRRSRARELISSTPACGVGPYLARVFCTSAASIRSSMSRAAFIPPTWLRADEPPPPQQQVFTGAYKWHMPGARAGAHRSVVRMPLPFCSLSDSLAGGRWDAAQQKAVPKLLVGSSKQAEGKNEAPEERILISEVRARGGTPQTGPAVQWQGPRIGGARATTGPMR